MLNWRLKRRNWQQFKMTSTDQKIGEILATVRATDLRLSEHLADYKETKTLIHKVEKRQIAVLAWVAGAFASVGGGIVAMVSRLSG